MSERKEGWYWVKVGRNRKWHCGYWSEEFQVWDVPTFLSYQQPDDMAGVGPRIPTPDEMQGWKLVPSQPVEQQTDNAFWAWPHTDVNAVYIDMVSAAPSFDDTVD